MTTDSRFTYDIDTGIFNAPSINLTDGSFTRSELSAAAGNKDIQKHSATIATTGNTDCYVIVPESGSLAEVDFSGVDVLATSDSNYITWTITNLGQAGAGSTVMLATSPAGTNTTKVTGGTALGANTKRSLVLAVAANLVVVKGDRLQIRAAATGTLANTVTFPEYMLRFSGTN